MARRITAGMGGRYIAGPNGFDPNFVQRIQSGGPVGVLPGGPATGRGGGLGGSGSGSAGGSTGDGSGSGGVPTTQPGSPGQSGPGLPGNWYNPTPGSATPTGPNPDISQMFKDIFQQSTQGSAQAQNNAANRLRERVTAAEQGQMDQTRQRFASEGGFNGSVNTALQDVQANSQGAYSQGLSDLEQGFEGQRLQGLNTALGATNSLQGGDEFARNLFQNLLQSREAIASNEKIGKMNNNTQLMSQLKQLLEQFM